MCLRERENALSDWAYRQRSSGWWRSDRGTEEILTYLGKTGERNKLIDMGIGQPAFDMRTILNGSRRLPHKRMLDFFSAAGTAADGKMCSVAISTPSHIASPVMREV